jgi:HD-like signal output (HDOD) protein
MITNVSNILSNIEQLPLLSSTSVQLIKLLNDSKTSINEIVDVIQYDQSLTIKVLSICNSAYFGLTRQINSIREAVAYLGTKPLMQIIMGLHCNGMLKPPRKGYNLSTGMLWRHSTAVAIATDKLVKFTPPNNAPAGLLFTAGLLHDFGKVVLDQTLAEQYQDVVDYMEHKPVLFHEAEHEVLGYNHMEVGEMIMQHWKLPEVMAVVCRYHHQPDQYAGDDTQIIQILKLVHASDSIAMSMGFGIGNDGLMYEFESDFTEELKLTSHIIDTIGMEVLTEIQSLENLQ